MASKRMNNLLGKIRSSHGVDGAVTAPIIDDHLEDAIKSIARECGTHTMGISIRRQVKDQEPEYIYKMIQDGQTVTSSGSGRFHIASITKIIVAVAFIIAVEVKSKQNAGDNRYSRFRDIEGQSFTQVYNKYCETKDRLKELPDDPKSYHILVHRKGFLSANDLVVAPCATPLRTLAEVPQWLLRHTVRGEVVGDSKTWRKVYSNVNYSAIAMLINVLWDGGLESFLKETLLQPLKMDSTFVGTPTDHPTGNIACVVDSNGKAHSIKQPVYRADGAEAAAFGIYSTPEDLDKLFKFIMDTLLYRPTGIPGIKPEDIRRLFNMTYHATTSSSFTPLGLYTKLDSSTVGELSMNRLQFPDEQFCTYTVQQPEQNALNIPVYYMAGSALGSACATALHFAEEEFFAITVLTDTSGPVDAADHALRCILQNMVRWMYSVRDLPQPTKLVDIESSVILNKKNALHHWKAKSDEMQQKMNNAVTCDMDIEGMYKAEDFNQHLSISKDNDGKTKITIYGTTQSTSSRPLDLIWVDRFSVQICVPQHESVDILDEWSNLAFRVGTKGQSVETLTRITSLQKKMVFKRVK